MASSFNPYRCGSCGHLHGARRCAAVYTVLVDTFYRDGTGRPRSRKEPEERHCTCPYFRRSVVRTNAFTGHHARMVNRGSTAFTNPLYHFGSYTMRNPVVAWCVERGIYVDLEADPPERSDAFDDESYRLFGQFRFAK